MLSLSVASSACDHLSSSRSQTGSSPSPPTSAQTNPRDLRLLPPSLTSHSASADHTAHQSGESNQVAFPPCQPRCVSFSVARRDGRSRRGALCLVVCVSAAFPVSSVSSSSRMDPMESSGTDGKGPEVLDRVEMTLGKQMTMSLTCPVCFGLFQDPCVLSCGHTFCKSCIDGVNKRSLQTGIPATCPMDRLPCQQRRGQVVSNPNFTLKSMLATCNVRCRNAYQKCDGEPAWELRPVHLR